MSSILTKSIIKKGPGFLFPGLWCCGLVQLIPSSDFRALILVSSFSLFASSSGSLFSCSVIVANFSFS